MKKLILVVGLYLMALGAFAGRKYWIKEPKFGDKKENIENWTVYEDTFGETKSIIPKYIGCVFHGE